MGIFQHFQKIFNRAPVTLSVFFDGQREPILSGLGAIPEVAVGYAKNQNPVMGSADPNNPHMSGARYLIVTEEDEGYGVPMTDEEWLAHLGRPCRIDEEAAFQERYGGDPKAKLVTHGKGKKTTAGSRFEAGNNPVGLANFSHKDA